MSEKLYIDKKYCGSWNFGPKINKIYTVNEITKKIINICKYKKKYKVVKDDSKKEAKFLLLNSKKANKYLNWKPIINIDDSLKHTIEWHFKIKKNKKYESIKSQIFDYYNKMN